MGGQQPLNSCPMRKEGRGQSAAFLLRATQDRSDLAHVNTDGKLTEEVSFTGEKIAATEHVGIFDS